MRFALSIGCLPVTSEPTLPVTSRWLQGYSAKQVIFLSETDCTLYFPEYWLNSYILVQNMGHSLFGTV